MMYLDAKRNAAEVVLSRFVARVSGDELTELHSLVCF